MILVVSLVVTVAGSLSPFGAFDNFIDTLERELTRNEEIIANFDKIEKNKDLKSRSFFETAMKAVNPYVGHYRQG